MGGWQRGREKCSTCLRKLEGPYYLVCREGGGAVMRSKTGLSSGSFPVRAQGTSNLVVSEEPKESINERVMTWLEPCISTLNLALE